MPELLPIFPLTGSLLLPGNFLPLNIFEPRYTEMVRDAMNGGRRIGMIQPRVPAADNWGAAADSSPELYSVGCAGTIERCEPQPDGRFVIVLKGTQRFRVSREIELRNGYRRVVPDWSGFELDLDPSEEGLEPSRLVGAVSLFGEQHGFEFDLELLAALPGPSLVNALAAALPFEAAEKQALLEAASTLERQEMLLELLAMGVEPGPPAPFVDAPTVN